MLKQKGPEFARAFVNRLIVNGGKVGHAKMGVRASYHLPNCPATDAKFDAVLAAIEKERPDFLGECAEMKQQREADIKMQALRVKMEAVAVLAPLAIR
ncbi:MAG TPA: hypothetical protein PLL10_08145 [Elusimicrobiales bacterium]|nr:hypothetical protein [Elusimicrobiales bacterium]